MNQKHEWLDQFGIVCGIVAGPDGTIQATDEQMADEILRLSAALAKASEERLTLARIVDEMTPRNEIGDCQFCGSGYNRIRSHREGCVFPAANVLAERLVAEARVVEESGNG